MGSSRIKCKSVDLSTEKSDPCCLKVASEHVTTSSITCELKDIDSVPGGHNIDIYASNSSMESDSKEVCHIDVSDIDMKDSISDLDTDDIYMATKCGCISDICGLVDTKFMIQAGVCYAELKSLSDNVSVSDFHPLRQECKNGDHYLTKYEIYRRGSSVTLGSLRAESNFYVIKHNSCIQVGSLEYGFCDIETKHVFELHPECQGGSFYLANRAGFYIIRREDNTYLQVRDMSKKGYQSSTASCHKLHESFINGLYTTLLQITSFTL